MNVKSEYKTEGFTGILSWNRIKRIEEIVGLKVVLSKYYFHQRYKDDHSRLKQRS